MTRLGISIYRRELACVLVREKRGEWLIFEKQTAIFERGEWRHALAAVLNGINGLKERGAATGACQVAVALSPAFTACADGLVLPLKSEAKLEALAPALAESRCVGETTEELAVDALIAGKRQENRAVHLLAVRRALIAELVEALREALPASRLLTVSSAPMILAKALKDKEAALALAAAGEELSFVSDGNAGLNWAARPLSKASAAASDRAGMPRLNDDDEIDLAGLAGLPGLADSGVKVPARYAAAFAAAVASPEHACNVLSDKTLPQTAPSRLHALALRAMGAAALLLFGIGLYLNTRIGELRRDLGRCEALERQAWAVALPRNPFQSGRLGPRIEKLVALNTVNTEANAGRSALDVWSAIAASMPAPDAIGFSLDTLQIGPDGARMNGRVARGKSDPLSFATTLESALNRSAALSARGEFEASKEGDVVVRLRIDSRKLPGANPSGAKP